MREFLHWEILENKTFIPLIPNGNGKNHDDNKHEILLHLNLFSKKPASYGGRAEDIDIDLPSPFTRQDAAMTKSENNDPIHLELPSPSETIKGHPVFGNLNPFDILQHLLKQSLGRKESAGNAKSARPEDNLTSRNFYSKSEVNTSSHKSNNESVSPYIVRYNEEINRRIDTSDDYEYVDEEDGTNDKAGEAGEEPEYYYYYYYDYLDSGIDISHELTTYEPLPSPLPLAADSVMAKSENVNEGEATTSNH